MAHCKNCNETLIGDGYTSVMVCPYSDNEDTPYMAPDEGPVYCDFKEEEADTFSLSNVKLAYKLLLGFPELIEVRQDPHRLILSGSQSDCQKYATLVKEHGGEALFRKGKQSSNWYVSVAI